MERELGSTTSARTRALAQPVTAVGLGLVALQAIFRAWALYPSWFYTDDYRLIYDATHSELTVGYLVEPFDSQFMPLGRLLAWCVAESGQLNWAMAASLTLVLQVIAGLSFLWMLITLFGPRWGILAPLTLLLTSALTVPALMWWAASLNQLPLQIVIPLAVGTWVNYLRTRHLGWLTAALAAVAFGLLAYVKTVLVVPLLAYLMFALFCPGGLREKIISAVRRYWPAGLAFGTLGVAFTAYYVTQVPSIVNDDGLDSAWSLGGTMLGKSLVTGLVGGPVKWEWFNPPVAVAAPPLLLVVAAWVVVLAVVAHTFLTRRRTARFWTLAALYATAAYLLLLSSRTGVLGAFSGTELRYLTEVLPVACLCLALATMEVLGAPGSSTPRPQPLLTTPVNAATVVAASTVVALLGVVSTARYAQGWHDSNPGADYLERARADIRELDQRDFASQPVPGWLIPGYSAPYNLTDHLLPLGTDAQFPEQTDHLLVLAESGKVREAMIDAGVTAAVGPTENCGWRVDADKEQTIPLTGPTLDWDWWIRIGYLASQATTVEVTAGDDTVDAQLHPGPNSLFVKVEGSFDEVTVGALSPGAAVCIDVVEVGTPIPGGAP